MKKIICLVAFLTLVCFTNAQIMINNLSSNIPTNSSVSLEFGTENRGIILPYNTDISKSVEGTLLLDVNDGKIKYKNGPNTNDWFELSNAALLQDITNSISIQENKIEQLNAKVTLGRDAESDTTNGVLVLTDKDKAMILPKLANPHLNIVDPATGMIAYDTIKKQIAIFNGTEWSFWKP